MSGEATPGALVIFKGGLGRGDDPTKRHTGIVNGPTFFQGGGAYVPVHVRELSHNLVVLSTNIVRVLP